MGILGLLMILAGSFMITLPEERIFLLPNHEGAGDIPQRISKAGMRVYGYGAVVLGAGLIWLGRWPRWGARRTAIEDYVWGLSQELCRRFGTKKYYSVEQVSRIAGESGYRKAYLAYAHAMFCSRGEFDEYYGPLHVACTYDGLREVIARRYFGGGRGFDAAAVVRLATPPKEREYDFHQGPEGF